MTSRRAADLLAVAVVSVAAALVSAGRLWLGNHDALTEVLWAEDGLFPLCIRKAGFLDCLVDPFAGYLLALPRALAGIVALFPVTAWPVAANLLAAALAGASCGLCCAWARRFGAGWAVAVAIGLLPVLAPVIGFEAVNSLGSSYMLLLYASTLVLAMPRPAGSGLAADWTWAQVSAVGALLLTTALTIPTAAALVALVAVQFSLRAIPARAAIAWVLAILVGLLAQWQVVTHAASPRSLEVSAGSLSTWLASLPDTALTYWPGLRLADFDSFGVFPVVASPLSGPLMAAALVAGGLMLVRRRAPRPVAIGLLLLTGTVASAVPTIVSGPSNRYFVVPALLWGAAALLAVDPLASRARWWAVAVAVILVGAIWWPMLPARGFRADPVPPWSAALASVQSACRAAPGSVQRLVFSPDWPPRVDAAVAEPSHPDVPCVLVRSWG